MVTRRIICRSSRGVLQEHTIQAWAAHWKCQSIKVYPISIAFLSNSRCRQTKMESRVARIRLNMEYAGTFSIYIWYSFLFFVDLIWFRRGIRCRSLTSTEQMPSCRVSARKGQRVRKRKELLFKKLLRIRITTSETKWNDAKERNKIKKKKEKTEPNVQVLKSKQQKMEIKNKIK